jgi:hypothetical protein
MIIATSTVFAAALLPDGSHGIQHAETECWVARWDGAPARWPGLLRAKLDADALGRGERPQHCLDILAPAPATWWACPKPGCVEPRSDAGDCPVHEIPLVPIGPDGLEVIRHG